MPRHTVTSEERAERRQRYKREYQHNCWQSLQIETSETETQQRNSMSQAEYMREYWQNCLQTVEMKVIPTVEVENINTSQVVETVEAENISNSRAEYMWEYRRRCPLTAEIEVVQAEVVRAQVIQAEVVGTEIVGTEVVETEAAETEEENHNSRAEYMREYRKDPTCICGYCEGLFFQKDISSVKRTALTGNWGCSEDIVEKTFWAIDNHKIPSTFVGEDIIDNIPLCSTCITSLKKKTLPTLALSNGLHFPDHVSIWTHKGLTEQYRSKGGIINVPVNVDTMVSLLPCNLDDSNTIHLSLARRMRYIKDYIRGNLSPAKVWRAALFLQSTTLYQEYNISLSDNWVQEVANNDTENVEEVDRVEDFEGNEESSTEHESINSSEQETAIVSDHEALRL
ncbi:hypothetical protein PHYBLDRAFT_148439 [Phycomyces blakesleeanus NRRL 1555(-)]|uniref:Uncharacterized protein n=2 Tax=Phycomyces blakesleeanus (strain ATCC 8743b / DSM 1359 / FGSC 10004 / NBRC 33097 / NRRL 1555) TaxID=763407 RepID=A0A167LIC8_PHYB8|nr:hypothetical protein PHYBLDRAFT_148439 [Phycomyces blakesleeanus NRRL 1555(-)]OAD70525.1 hypothetical protein PHYBLDRAFT_148439 [Phycomyces blakesleeanus NRRL 1555(-)]|eukprot:XP_018288565.1 hypothetical protein PHYBLDRAFT_148439 [Phycomyces blakesleeanus NRRL 1555(-)]